jgi:hypothetical protein
LGPLQGQPLGSDQPAYEAGAVNRLIGTKTAVGVEFHDASAEKRSDAPLGPVPAHVDRGGLRQSNGGTETDTDDRDDDATVDQH